MGETGTSGEKKRKRRDKGKEGIEGSKIARGKDKREREKTWVIFHRFVRSIVRNIPRLVLRRPWYLVGHTKSVPRTTQTEAEARVVWVDFE